MSFLNKLFGDPNQKVVAKLQPIVDQINALSSVYENLTAEQLKNKTVELREQLKNGKTLDDILPDAFAGVREANRRANNARHFDVQLIGGMVLHRGEIAEMKTGEGKTHVAALALYLNALDGKGSHLVTVNDYLAKRDAGWNGRANDLIGVSTACIIHDQAFIFDSSFVDESQKDDKTKHLRPCSRREAYLADITYGTNAEFGFDYLRDNMVPTLEHRVQRDLHYAIVDEVDSILIDEARTPLIISAAAEESADLYRQFSQLVPRLKSDEDYTIDEKLRTAILTEAGFEKMEQALGTKNIYAGDSVNYAHHLEQALRAMALFKRDKDYVVKDGEVIIIDEFTGRLMQGRRYSDGLHQAIEAKENVAVQRESRTLATITIQNLFRLYKKLSGMTGTAATEAEEFSKIYNLDVTAIPTNKPIVRKDLSDRIYSSERGKLIAVAREIKRLHEKGQPVLVGTISIEKNELLSLLLQKENVPHELLNAKQHEKEAQIISQAGRVGAVTVATNMAGRGVDIMLGGSPFNKEEYEKVCGLGGLFVLGTERHEARRIDNQLRGRAGRQGDPGASQFYISMEDDLMRVFVSDRVKNMMQRLGVPEDQPIENSMVSSSIEKAQKRVEGNNFDIRKHLVEYDDVANKQRDIIYKRRKEVLTLADENPAGLRDLISELIAEEIEELVGGHTAGEDQTKWDLKEMIKTARTIFPVKDDEALAISTLEKSSGMPAEDVHARTQIIDRLIEVSQKRYSEMEKHVVEQAEKLNEPAFAEASAGRDGLKYWRALEREIYIRSIDNLWMEHLEETARLRDGIGLRGYAQRDPLVEYKRETYQMFVQLLHLISRQVVLNIFRVGFSAQLSRVGESQQPIQAREVGGKEQGQFGAEGTAPVASPTIHRTKVGRNDLCPCGSNKKYKKCCGA
ncbi:MAG: preprotein translocase subunit SecA [Parcubacteria group bacterium]